MPTLILPPRYTPDSIAVSKAAVRAGWGVERLGSWRVPDHLAGQEFVLYGEPLFAAVVADPLGLSLLEPPLDWLAGLSQELTRRRIRFTTLAEARNLTDPTFVKPAEDKCFPARVYESGRDLPGADVLSATTPVLVARTVDWQMEFRCFALDGEVLSLSPYLRDGKLAQAEDGSWPATEDELARARAFASAVLRDPQTSLPPAIVLDVGVIRGEGWAVVEANAAWGSGVYGCDPEQVLRVVQRACVASDRTAWTDNS
ncbi:MAG TPA: ATP-grasp domain-containing protein [Gemmataceae bacterium]|nr:ATP-grasp domain-containing protein [Gemmataceae bacterium]